MNQKRKGSDFERKIIKEINGLNLGYQLGSSRLYSYYMDNKGVDLVDTPDSLISFPFHIQCKSITGYMKYNEIFNEFTLNNKPLLVFHELTEKKGSRFFKISDYVIMKKEDFYEILKTLKNGK